MVVVVSSWQASNIIWHLLTRLNAICVLISSLQQPRPLESWGVRWFSLSPAFIPHMLPPSLACEGIVREVHGALHFGKQRKGTHIYQHTHIHTHIPLADLGRSHSALSVSFHFWLDLRLTDSCIHLSIYYHPLVWWRRWTCGASVCQNQTKWTWCPQMRLLTAFIFFFLLAACHSPLSPSFFFFLFRVVMFIWGKRQMISHVDDTPVKWLAEREMIERRKRRRSGSGSLAGQMSLPLIFSFIAFW